MKLEPLYKISFNTTDTILDIIQDSNYKTAIRSYNSFYSFHQSTLNFSINFDEHELIETTYLGTREYAFFVKDNYAYLTNKSSIHRWSLSDKSYDHLFIKKTINPLPQACKYSLRPHLAGKTNNSNIPIIFETSTVNETVYFSFLNIEELSWQDELPRVLNKFDYPLKDYQIFNQDSYQFPDVNDLAIIDGKIYSFTTGFHNAYGKYDMDYSIFIEIDNANRKQGKEIFFNNCFGRFSSDLKWLIISPLSKTKIKPYLMNLETKESVEIAFPKGCSNFYINDVNEDVLLISNVAAGKNSIRKFSTTNDLKLVALKIIQ